MVFTAQDLLIAKNKYYFLFDCTPFFIRKQRYRMRQGRAAYFAQRASANP